MSSSKKILIVEDDKIIAFELQLNLENLGYIITGTATNYEEAVRLAISTEPDLALMDIQIKGTKTGIDAAKTLRENLDIPVIFLTSTIDEATIAEAIETEPEGYLMKPVRKEELRNNIEIAYLNSKRKRQLQENINRFSAVMQNLDSTIVIIDSDGKVSYMNAPAEETTGWLSLEKAGSNIDDLLRLNDESGMIQYLSSKISNQRQDQQSITLPDTSYFRTKMGSKVAARGAVSPFYNAEGDLKGYYFSLDKITGARTSVPQVKIKTDDDQKILSANSFLMDGYFFIRDKSQLYRININDVLYIEALGDYVNVFTEERKYTTLMTMKKLEAMLPQNIFARVHRSYIASIDKITEINSNEFDLYIKEKRIPIGETYKAELMKKIKVI